MPTHFLILGFNWRERRTFEQASGAMSAGFSITIKDNLTHKKGFENVRETI